MTMTTKELLALVERWRARATEHGDLHRKQTGYEVSFEDAGKESAYDNAADELAPIATALCAEVDDLMKSAAMLAVERAEFRIRAENTPRLILLAIAEQFEEMAQAARRDGELERRDVWRDAASQARARINHADWIDAAIDAAKEPK